MISRLVASLVLLPILALGACGSAQDPAVARGDTTAVPPENPDSGGVDSVPPPDSTPTAPPPGPGAYEGLAFGPADVPPEHFAEFSATVYTATSPDTLLMDLEAARQARTRLFVSFTGNEQYNRDSNGFSLDQWKQRVDRFRGVDLTPYIDDGTIIGHYILDEPNDPTNWSGKVVPQAHVEAMAEYSKQIWPSMVTKIRAKTDYLLAGGKYPHLDAVRAQYAYRFGPLSDYISTSVEEAKALGLALVGGLNVLNGGDASSGIPGRNKGKYAMSADEIRSLGNTYLSEPYICAFILFDWDSAYFARPEIREAISELSAKARSLPNRVCRP